MAYIIAKIKIGSGRPKKIIEQCKNGELILSIYTHNMSRHQLNSIIHWLKKQEISLISVAELNTIIYSKNPIPKGKCILTMDDGWYSNISIMSLSEKLNFPVCIFLTTDPIENGGGFWWSYIKKAKALGLTVENVEWYKKLENEKREKAIEELKKLIKIKREALKPSMIISHKHSSWISFGVHTKHHPILPKCDVKTVENEIMEAQQKIKEWLGNSVSYFAYPNGSFGKKEVEVLKTNDFQLAFTTNASPIEVKGIDPFKIPRCEILENVSLAENICRLTGSWVK